MSLHGTVLALLNGWFPIVSRAFAAAPLQTVSRRLPEAAGGGEEQSGLRRTTYRRPPADRVRIPLPVRTAGRFATPVLRRPVFQPEPGWRHEAGAARHRTVRDSAGSGPPPGASPSRRRSPSTDPPRTPRRARRRLPRPGRGAAAGQRLAADRPPTSAWRSGERIPADRDRSRPPGIAAGRAVGQPGVG